VADPLACPRVKQGLIDFGHEGPDVPENSRRGTPRASRLIIDVFDAISSCGDLIHYWDVAKRADGAVLLRATSARRYTTEEAAADAAQVIAARIQPPGHQIEAVTAVARTDGNPDAAWQAFVEVVIA
jgi:hypothetical protein